MFFFNIIFGTIRRKIKLFFVVALAVYAVIVVLF